MKNHFSTMRLWIVSLLTLGAVLIQGPAQAQSIGPLKETYDGGKTWQPEGTGRPSQGSSGEGYTPSVSPEEAARQQAEAARQREISQHNAACDVNDQGIEYGKKGNWEKAVESYRKAHELWPEDKTIQDNLAYAEKEWVAQQKAMEEQRAHALRDAAVTGSLQKSVDHLIAILPNQGAVDFDGSAGGKLQPQGGLDFMTGPAPALSKASAGAVREPNTDPNVVDLRDAKTFTVDPARVKGADAATPAPQQKLEFMPIAAPGSAGETKSAGQAATGAGQENFVKATGEALRDSVAAQEKGDAKAKAEADKRLKEASEQERQRLAQEQAKAHQEMLDDMKMLRVNGDKYIIALEEAKARARAKELTALKAATEKLDKDSREHLALIRKKEEKKIKMNSAEEGAKADAIINRYHAEQAAAIKQAYDEVAAEVKRLKKELLADTNGRPVMPLTKEEEDQMAKDSELLFQK